MVGAPEAAAEFGRKQSCSITESRHRGGKGVAQGVLREATGYIGGPNRHCDEQHRRRLVKVQPPFDQALLMPAETYPERRTSAVW